MSRTDCGVTRKGDANESACTGNEVSGKKTERPRLFGVVERPESTHDLGMEHNRFEKQTRIPQALPERALTAVSTTDGFSFLGIFPPGKLSPTAAMFSLAGVNSPEHDAGSRACFAHPSTKLIALTITNFAF